MGGPGMIYARLLCGWYPLDGRPWHGVVKLWWICFLQLGTEHWEKLQLVSKPEQRMVCHTNHLAPYTARSSSCYHQKTDWKKLIYSMESMVNGQIHGCNISGHVHRQNMLMGDTPWWNAPTETENGSSTNTILKAKNIQTIFMARVAQRRKFQHYRFYMVHTEGNEIIGTSMWQSQDKTRWQEDWSNQITAIHIQKANLHLTTHIPCVPRCSPFKSEQLLHFSPP
jgi:hypothetical protein